MLALQALKHGYYVKFIEPDTSWKGNVKELARYVWKNREKNKRTTATQQADKTRETRFDFAFFFVWAMTVWYLIKG